MAKPAQPSRAPTHAVVIGGSVAGLLAARVLTEHYDRVTVLEKDLLRDDDQPRKGVPQGRHVHAMLIRGQRIIERLFPGFSEWMISSGALTPNMGQDAAWHVFGSWRPRYTSELAALSASRPLLERGIRRFALATPGITFRGGCSLTGLLTDEARSAARGVRFKEEGAGEDGLEQTLHADLVVDASGRGSRTPKLLEALGCPVPEETVVPSGAAYATRVFKLADRPRAWTFCYVQPTPGNGTRGAIIAPIEGGKHIATLIGMAGDHPPTTEEGFMAFADSLPTAEIATALREATPCSPIYGFARAENRRRAYEALPRHLEGLLVLGDANMALNPVYGQGMTAAAIGAETLGAVLRDATGPEGVGVPGLARAFQRALSGALAVPWQMATGEDRRWPGYGDGATPGLGARLINRFMDHFQRGTLRSPELTEAFYRVAQMVDGPTSLFAPRVLWHLLTSRFRAPQPALPVSPDARALRAA